MHRNVLLREADVIKYMLYPNGVMRWFEHKDLLIYLQAELDDESSSIKRATETVVLFKNCSM